MNDEFDMAGYQRDRMGPGPDVVRAPWTPLQVRSLNISQTVGVMHPYTCGNRGDGNHEQEDVLVATLDGWVCPYCNYRQGWCHRVDTEWSRERR